VSGAPALGALLGCDGGLWTGAVTVATAWLRGLAEVASSPGYSVSAPDQGSALACRARASNPFGTVEATGAPVAIPTAAAAAAPAPVPSPGPAPAPAPTPGPPSARSLPAIRGSARVGRTLTCRPARFAGATRTTTAWLRGGKAIPKATKTRYKLTRRDRRRLVTCRTAATGPGGRSTVVSFGVLVR
jgi:pyruvate/2-oxoglutarate dehydrogenase complex dihydrolipoamide acyltransferase (E2) component